MKNILVLFMLCLFAFSVQAQKTKTIDLEDPLTYVKYTGFTSADTVSATQTPYYLKVNAEKAYTTGQNTYLKLTKVTAGRMTIQLQGSMFGSDWTNIGSAVNWYQSTADTAIIITNATANQYRFYRQSVTRVGGKCKLTQFEFKQFIK